MKQEIITTPKAHVNRRLSLEQLMGLAKPPKQEAIHQFESENGEIEVMNRGLTMVLSREVYANVRIAAEIAVSVARKNPDRPVWYVNTFAGVELMQTAMDIARQKNGLAKLVPNPVIEEESDEDEAESKEDVLRRSFHALPEGPSPERPWERWVQGSEHSAGHWYRISNHDEDFRRYVEKLEQAERAEKSRPAKRAAKPRKPVPPTPTDLLPNLHYFEIPLGEWDLDVVALAIRDAADDAQDKPNRPIVIINSFDYSPLSRGGKWRMARELLKLLEAFDMSLVVFTQEMRLEFVAGIAGRGSLGLLCGLAARVCRMKDPFEHLIRTRHPRIQPDNATVHEAQMHAPKSKKVEKSISIVLKDGRGKVFREVTGSKPFQTRHARNILRR